MEAQRGAGNSCGHQKVVIRVQAWKRESGPTPRCLDCLITSTRAGGYQQKQMRNDWIRSLPYVYFGVPGACAHQADQDRAVSHLKHSPLPTTDRAIVSVSGHPVRGQARGDMPRPGPVPPSLASTGTVTASESLEGSYGPQTGSGSSVQTPSTAKAMGEADGSRGTARTQQHLLRRHSSFSSLTKTTQVPDKPEEPEVCLPRRLSIIC